MRAVIPWASVKAFHCVLECLSKIGDDIIVEARPDRFTMSTLNITRSAFAKFTFTRTFFESYHLDTNGEAIQQDDNGHYLRCSVLAKALVSACRIRGNVEQKIEKCCLFMNSAEGVGENCRLTVEIIFKHGFIKIHKLLYESCPEALQVLDSVESCPSSWRLPAAGLMGLLDNFSSKSEEITMECLQDVMNFKAFKNLGEGPNGSARKTMITSVGVLKNTLESYRLRGNVELTFSLKEFRAIVAFAVALRRPLDGHFDAQRRPLLLAIESENILTANFALATVIDYDNNDEDDIRQRERAGTHPADVKMNNLHQDIDLSQPENALFLDDDVDWDALDDIEMEESAPAAGSSAAAGGSHPQPQQPQHNGNYAKHQPHNQKDASSAGAGLGKGVAKTSRAGEEAVFEIEEGFLPSSERQTKKARFNFEDDDDD